MESISERIEKELTQLLTDMVKYEEEASMKTIANDDPSSYMWHYHSGRSTGMGDAVRMLISMKYEILKLLNDLPG